MSENQPNLESPEPEPLIREPRSLSSEYHKAHKQLMLWAAILFVWEFVGIDLEKAKDAEGYAGALVKSLKSPQAVPWVLLVLVVYFLFKCSTEWAQCQQRRRKMRYARVDFVSAWIVSLAAVALYVVQTVGRVQLADFVQSRSQLVFSLLYGMIASLFLVTGTRSFLALWRSKEWDPLDLWVTLFFWGGSIGVVVMGSYLGLRLPFIFVGIPTGVGIAIITRLLRRWGHRRWFAQKAGRLPRKSPHKPTY